MRPERSLHSPEAAIARRPRRLDRSGGRRRADQTNRGHVEVPASVRKLHEQAIADRTEGRRRTLEGVRLGTGSAAVDVLTELAVDLIATLATVASLPLEGVLAVRHDRHRGPGRYPGLPADGVGDRSIERPVLPTPSPLASVELPTRSGRGRRVVPWGSPRPRRSRARLRGDRRSRPRCRSDGRSTPSRRRRR